ncbi:MAG: PRC-barrel domain-containing protein [Variibacter sp.]|nr:PRC-barrel domain-containing protein [Variibacter sp.]
MSGPQFISTQTADQFLASKFSGTDVIGPNNEKIGDVSDVLFDKSGKVLGVVVGVGGFLGIGQKDVAIDMSAFQMVPASMTDTNVGSARTAANTDPHDVKLKVSWTKDQLKAAPTFERYKAASASGTTTTPATAPRPAAPQR